MMDVFEAIKNRRSVRNFKPEAVPDEKVNKILEAFFWAPSAGNLQARDIILIKDLETREKLSRAAHGQYFIREAPIVFVVTANKKNIMPYGNRGINLYCLQDAAAGIQNMLLTAYSEGLGSCWVGSFNEKEVAKILSLPEYAVPVALIPAGKPLGKTPTPKRVKVVHAELW